MMQGTEDPVPRKSKGLLKRFQLFLILKAGRKAWVFLLAMAGCAWGTKHVFGGTGQFLKSETEFIREMCAHVSPALLLDLPQYSNKWAFHPPHNFLLFLQHCCPFIQFGALVGKTQEMDVPELLTLKGALDAILLKLGSVQCQHSFTRVFCPMHET